MTKPKITWSKRLIVCLVISFLLVVVDFAVKWIVELNCAEYVANEVIPNFFYITKSYNTAVAFSIGRDWGVWGRVLNITVSVVMSGLIYFYWLTHDRKLTRLERAAAVLLGAGAVGNLIDRAFYWEATTGFDGVIDMFQFYLGGGPSAPAGFFNPFATFNVADACLVIGIVIVLIALIVDAIVHRDTSMTRDPRLEQKPAPIAQPKPEETPVEEPEPVEVPKPEEPKPEGGAGE